MFSVFNISYKLVSEKLSYKWSSPSFKNTSKLGQFSNHLNSYAVKNAKKKTVNGIYLLFPYQILPEEKRTFSIKVINNVNEYLIS